MFKYLSYPIAILISGYLFIFVVNSVFPDNGTSRDEKKQSLFTVLDPIGHHISEIYGMVILSYPSLDPQGVYEIRTEYQESKNRQFNQPLQRLKQNGDIEAYNALKQEYVQQLFTSVKSSDGNMSDTKALLSTGLDINVQDDKGRTILFYATSIKKDYLVRYLLSQGADRELKDYAGLRPVDLLDRQKDQALYLSFHHEGVQDKANAKGLSSVNALYSYDQDNNIVATKVYGEVQSSWSPLMLAIKENNTDIALQHINTNENLEAQTNNGSTALFATIKYSRRELLDALLAHHVNIEHRNSFNMSPLAFAIKLNNLYAVIKLVENGANVHTVCASGRTPLKYAEANQRTRIARYLKSVGSD